METEGNQERLASCTALEAVWWLAMLDTLSIAESKPSSYKELLDRPFEMLTSDEWKQLQQYEPIYDSRELVVA